MMGTVAVFQPLQYGPPQICTETRLFVSTQLCVRIASQLEVHLLQNLSVLQCVCKTHILPLTFFSLKYPLST